MTIIQVRRACAVWKAKRREQDGWKGGKGEVDEKKNEVKKVEI